MLYSVIIILHPLVFLISQLYPFIFFFLFFPIFSISFFLLSILTVAQGKNSIVEKNIYLISFYQIFVVIKGDHSIVLFFFKIRCSSQFPTNFEICKIKFVQVRIQKLL